jgi:hypothetical protein
VTPRDEAGGKLKRFAREFRSGMRKEIRPGLLVRLIKNRQRKGGPAVKRDRNSDDIPRCFAARSRSRGGEGGKTRRRDERLRLASLYRFRLAERCAPDLPIIGANHPSQINGNLAAAASLTGWLPQLYRMTLITAVIRGERLLLAASYAMTRVCRMLIN